MRRVLSTIERWRRLLGPFVSLASGMVSVLLLRRGLNFAPVAAACVILAWTLVTGIGRWLPARAKETRTEKAVRWLARYLVAALYQDVLFFLLPVWFESATWPSENIVGPIVLALLALFSCFDHAYRRVVLDHPLVRTATSALILFASLLAATPVVFATSLIPNVVVSAAVSTLLLAIALLPQPLLTSARGVTLVAALTALASAVSLPIARYLPPVPVQCLRSETATEIKEREPRDPRRVFEPNPPRVYAWFAVAAPEHFAQAVGFRWFHEDRLLAGEFKTNIAGGRKTGFRTWGAVTAPGPGRWRVELFADSGQLIGRQSFFVVSATVAASGDHAATTQP
jgi:hypothetical protein